jgi:hypothetical protein
MTTVVNKRTDQYDVYVGRGSIFGNPYEMGVDFNSEMDTSRNWVISRYRTWFKHMLHDPVFREAIKHLKDKRLGCFCAPQACHGDVIAEYLNNNLL